jgi:flagellin
MSDFSINTNVDAQVALANLNTIDTNLSTVQNQVSTGLKVSSATDNAAVFAVAQGIRANLSQYDAVNTTLNNGLGVTNVAITGATSVSNLLQNITSTLTSLSDGTISDQQRQTYTTELKSQIDEVQTILQQSTYNGVNLINASQGSLSITNGGFTAFSSANNISILAGANGGAITVHAQDLFGGTAGTDGFLGLARLVYYAGSAANTVGDTNSSAYLYTNSSGLVSRSEVGSAEAQAALAAVSDSASAFVSAAGAAGISSVFGAAIGNFTNQVNAALGSLGSDTNNLQLQITFNQNLSDAVNTGLGNLVDANLASASALLTSLQTQQQLATQSLSIANSAPQIILKLFES